MKFIFISLIVITAAFKLEMNAESWKTLTELEPRGLHDVQRHSGWVSYLQYEKPFLPPVSSRSISNGIANPYILNVICIWDKVSKRIYLGAEQDKYLSIDNGILGITIVDNLLAITERNDICTDEKSAQLAMEAYIDESINRAMSEMRKPDKVIQIADILGKPSLFGTEKNSNTNKHGILTSRSYNALIPPYTYEIVRAEKIGNEISVVIKNAYNDIYSVYLDKTLNVVKILYENIELPILGIEEYKVHGINWRPYNIISIESTQGESVAFTTKGIRGEIGSADFHVYELVYIPSKNILSVHEPVKKHMVIGDTYIGLTYDDESSKIRIYRTNSRPNLIGNKKTLIKETILQEIENQVAEIINIGGNSDNTELIVRGFKTVENTIGESEAKIAVETVFPSSWVTITVNAQ